MCWANIGLTIQTPPFGQQQYFKCWNFSVGPMLGQCWQPSNNDVLSCNDSNHYLTLIQRLIASWLPNMQMMRYPKRKWNVWSRYPWWMFKNAPQGLYLIPVKSRPYNYVIHVIYRMRVSILEIDRGVCTCRNFLELHEIALRFNYWT